MAHARGLIDEHRASPSGGSLSIFEDPQVVLAPFIRLYHFVSAEHGLEDLRLRRLKIATIDDLNDPFELLCIDLTDPKLRTAMRAWKIEIAKRFGMLCFSSKWDNPVQWSHYADKHRGICLCFAVPTDSVQRVSYSGLRSREEIAEILQSGTTSEQTVLKFLARKYAHWRYEKEYRVFLRLEQPDPDKQLFFAHFSDKRKLLEVIVGSESTVKPKIVRETLARMDDKVTIRKARLSFKSFRVTT